MQTISVNESTWHPLADGIPPRWACEWGDDRYGPWATFQFGGVRQRLRWIPPGDFRMGSPEEEDGRWRDEWPPRRVRIATGFWIFETPCTQALWTGVVGQNPSRFQDERRLEQSATHPVEQVSWEDCVAFVDRLNSSLDGLTLALPSEAQWEYACRAGEQGPRYDEDLDAIAWYGGNSGGKTHEAGGKRPNRWGLHDMLGNVWEWCSDRWTVDDEKTPRADPSAVRVIRGGSWYDVAWDVRAACRNRFHPSDRFGVIGVRFSEFRESSVVSPAR